MGQPLFPGGVNPADVRFYFDADILGVGEVLAILRPDMTYPGDPGATIHRRIRPACPVLHPSVKDPVWLPEVARRGWVILTRDRHIRDRRRQFDLVREHDARLVVLVGDEAIGTWAQLEVIMTQWRRIEALQAGPYIYTASRTSWRRAL